MKVPNFGRKDRFYRSAKSKWGTPRKWGFSIWFFSTDFVRALKEHKKSLCFSKVKNIYYTVKSRLNYADFTFKFNSR
ncbi:hypothetical protein [Campylobacter hyointestinalis]|uniref:hypothetical protein n=1 Tax=Campylobacter hyointestinalis TaxID=198 RepID=UPI0011619C00|nr:hypothetical protein [Campylobacter hyointestinalis]